MEVLSIIEPSRLAVAVLLASALVSGAYCAVILLYNIFFHPLAKFPGPLSWRASRFPFIASLVTGNLVADVVQFHKKYGDIVRLAPNELSFAREEAYHDIFTNRGGSAPFPKNGLWFKAPLGQPDNMVTTVNHADSQRMRKVLSPAFTDRAIYKQEAIVQSYIQYFMNKLHQIATSTVAEGDGEIVTISDWFNFYTFDVIGDLGLGESFNGMKDSKYHPWVAMIFNYIKGLGMIPASRFFPILERIILRVIPAKIQRMQQEHYQIALSKIHRRMNLEKERDDFMSPVLKDNFKSMSLEEIESSFSMLIIAGSETSSTTLSGTVSYLVRDKQQLNSLAQEIREKFEDEADITFAAVKELPFLNAVVQEGLRLCNPVPGGLPRCVPRGGATVCGHFLPGDTHVSISPPAICFSPANFHRPTEFRAERFLPDDQRPAEYANDRRSAHYPFSLGSRSCIGKALALAQLRCVLARLVYHFDLEEVPEKSFDWLKLKTFIVVEKQPVVVRIKPRAERFSKFG